jgi:hypothetical protein
VTVADFVHVYIGWLIGLPPPAFNTASRTRSSRASGAPRAR